MAVHDSTSFRTYFTWVDSGYYVNLAYYSHVDGITTKAKKIGRLVDGDAHRTSSILIDNAGYIYIFWSSHGDNTHVSRSKFPRDFVTSFIACADITGSTTYPQPHELSDGVLTVLYRAGSGGWVSRSSNDRGVSWGSETVIALSNLNGVYAIGVSEEGAFPRKLHLIWTTIDTSVQVRKHFWYGVSTDGINWKNSNGTSYSLPVNETTAEKIFDSGTDQVNTQDIQLDSLGNSYMLISHGANGGLQAEDGGPWYFKLGKKKAGTWQWFDIAQGDHQFDNGGLLILANDDFRALLPTSASQINQDGGNIEEYKSINQGETWTKLATLTNDPLSHNNVKIVRGHQPGFRAFWSYGDSIDASEVTLRSYDDEVVRIIKQS